MNHLIGDVEMHIGTSGFAEEDRLSQCLRIAHFVVTVLSFEGQIRDHKVGFPDLSMDRVDDSQKFLSIHHPLTYARNGLLKTELSNCDTCAVACLSEKLLV